MEKLELQKHLTDFVRRRRDQIAAMQRPDPIAAPMTADMRIRYDEDGSGYTEYGILPENGPTSDDEIEEYIHDYIELPPIRGPYDCTGKFFTAYVDWKRTPAGIAIVHRVSRDI